MDPSHMSLCVLHRPLPQPFIIDDNNNHTYDDVDKCDTPPYMDTLRSVFGQVHILSSANAQADSCHLFLIDLDTFDSPIDGLDMIHTLVVETHKPVIVLSSVDDADFMCECTYAGACNYILKPLRRDVVKTLFLNSYRHLPVDCKMHEGVKSPSGPAVTTKNGASTTPVPSLPSTPVSYTDPVNGNEKSELAQMRLGLHERVLRLFETESSVIETLMDAYVPPPPVYHVYLERLSSQRTAELSEKTKLWDFCPFDYDHNELVHCTMTILRHAMNHPDLISMTRKISDRQLSEFIIDLSHTYYIENPYHNFAHAVDVLQCLYYMLFKCSPSSSASSDLSSILPSSSLERFSCVKSLLRPIDILALFIAALGHDAAHPGVNNQFMINARSTLATMFNDRSVLENLHAVTLWQVVKRHNLDRLAGDPAKADYQDFRKTIVSCILATDMSIHAEYVTKIKQLAYRMGNDHDVRRILEHPGDYAADRLLACCALIKCADISNVARPFRQCRRWAQVLVRECIQQGDLEHQFGLPVQPMNDRSHVVLENMQISFIRFVALDLFQCTMGIMPELEFTVEHILANLAHWEHNKNATHDSGVADLDVITDDTDDHSIDYNTTNEKEHCLRLSIDDSLYPLSSTSSFAQANARTHLSPPPLSPSSTPISMADPMTNPVWPDSAECRCAIQ